VSHLTQLVIGFPVDSHKQQMWFASWFLDKGYCDAPAVIWERHGNIVTRTYKPEYKRPSGKSNVPPMIWKLTDTWAGELRLGVWPD
jgi:hypothetical protein